MCLFDGSNKNFYSIHFYFNYLLYLLTFATLFAYLLLHARAAPIHVFRHAVQIEYNIDITDSVMKNTLDK